MCIAWNAGYNNPVPVIKISNYRFEYVVSGKVMQCKKYNNYDTASEIVFQSIFWKVGKTFENAS